MSSHQIDKKVNRKSGSRRRRQSTDDALPQLSYVKGKNKGRKLVQEEGPALSAREAPPLQYFLSTCDPPSISFNSNPSWVADELEELPDETCSPPSVVEEATTVQQESQVESHSLSRQDDPPPGSITEEDEEVFEGVLAPDTEQRRKQMLDAAVSATNVHADIQEITTENKKKHWVCIGLVLFIIVAFTIGVLGITLGRDKNDKPTNKSSSPTIMPSAMPSSVPSEVPTTAPFTSVATLIESLFGAPLPQDSSSPQYRAAEWIANVDTALDLSVVEPERFKQRYALVVFYYATGGEASWTHQASFLSADLHECDWFDPAPEEATFTITGFLGVFRCTEQMEVVTIELVQNNLTGTIPPEIEGLSRLDALLLNENNIGGSLPTSLFRLENLRTLWLPFNNFTGTIPSEIGNSSMVLFWMERHSVTGTLPSEIGNLSNLTSLRLGDGSISGTVPETLLNLSGLQLLDLHQNKLVGKLPLSFPSSWPNLKQISLDFNHLSGPLPTDIGTLSALQLFSVQSNSFTGPLPESVVNLEMMILLDFSENEFSGSLPNDWNRLSGSLNQFSVRENLLTGTIPASIGNLTTLSFLDVGTNSLTGTVPTSFQQLKSLFVLTLHRNELVGDLSFLCEGTDSLLPNIIDLLADCLVEVVCPCCTICCDEENECVNQ